jgi:lantibiotic biosynthesis protein
VVVGRLVLARATWNLRQTDLAPLKRATGAARLSSLLGLKTSCRWPRWVLFSESDRELPVDLENTLCLESLAELLRGRDTARITEMWPDPQHLCARGPEGRFTHELIVPFVQQPTAAVDSRLSRPEAPAHAQRLFMPGDEWLCFKLYGGAAFLDEFIGIYLGRILGVVRGLGIEEWFFCRYADPDWHLRLRFKGPPEVLYGHALPAVRDKVAPLVGSGHIWRIQLDSYEREVERYGGLVGVDIFERLSTNDSQAAMRIVELTGGAQGLDLRWRLTLLGIHQWLIDMGLSAQVRCRTVSRLRGRFAAEFKAGPELIRRLGERFHHERHRLRCLLAGEEQAGQPALAAGITALLQRSSGNAPLVANLRARASKGELTASIENMTESIVHMHANRLLRSSARAHELVVYDFLRRMYQTEIEERRGDCDQRRCP